MPYQSRLGGVLLVRRIREDEVSREWVVAKNQLLSEQALLDRLKLKLEATLGEMAGRQRTLVAEEMTLYFRFMRNLQEQITHQEKIVSHHEAICEERRLLLEQAVKERKAVEQVEDKRKAIYLERLVKKEQAELDEIGGRMKYERV